MFWVRNTQLIFHYIFMTDARTYAAADSEDFGKLYHIPVISKDKNFESKIVNIFLFISFNICFGCSKESSH